MDLDVLAWVILGVVGALFVVLMVVLLWEIIRDDPSTAMWILAAFVLSLVIWWAITHLRG